MHTFRFQRKFLPAWKRHWFRRSRLRRLLRLLRPSEIKEMIDVMSAIMGVAIIATLVSKKSNLPAVLDAAGEAFEGVDASLCANCGTAAPELASLYGSPVQGLCLSCARTEDE